MADQTTPAAAGEKKPREKWARIIVKPPVCDLCRRVAKWSHPAGGLRCNHCPRPNGGAR